MKITLLRKYQKLHPKIKLELSFVLILLAVFLKTGPEGALILSLFIAGLVILITASAKLLADYLDKYLRSKVD